MQYLRGVGRFDKLQLVEGSLVLTNIRDGKPLSRFQQVTRFGAHQDASASGGQLPSASSGCKPGRQLDVRQMYGTNKVLRFFVLHPGNTPTGN